MAKVSLTNGEDIEALVTSDQALLVTSTIYPPRLEQKIKPFRQYLTDDGTATGSNDMGVDGSVTAQEFFVGTDSEDDRYITALSFIIAYNTSGAPYLWADVAALINGVRIYYKSSHGDVDIHDSIKSNQDFFRLQGGGVDTTWEVRSVNANNDYGYFITVPLGDLIPPYGVKLDHGRTEKIIVSIRDDLSVSTLAMNCIAYGFDRFEH